MSEEWKAVFNEIREGAAFVREHCLNRNDAEFAPWHGKARNAIARHAPKKLPSFAEIRFASDYFLSKNREEQAEINDRIAVISDVDLFLQMVENISRTLEKTPKKPPATRSAPQPHSAGNVLASAREMIGSLSLSPRDRENALQEVERVERELSGPDPDWDSIKRSIKFFLDFDRNLALEAVPRILARVLKK